MHKIASPSIFTDLDKAPGVTVEDSGLTLSHPDNRAWRAPVQCIRANTFIPVDHDRMYYYEMTVVDEGSDNKIGLGFCGKDNKLNMMPGWEDNAWGYHSDDGAKFPGRPQGLRYGPGYGAGDVVGCGLDFKRGFAFYTLNGVYLGPAFPLKEGLRIWPMIGLGSVGAKVTINFGQQEFVWKGMDDLEKSLGYNTVIEYGQDGCCDVCGGEPVAGHD